MGWTKAGGLALSGMLLAWVASQGLSSGAVPSTAVHRPAPSVPEGVASAIIGGGNEAASFRYMGTSTCASMACHNGQGAPGVVGSEYGAWAAQPPDDAPCDKHGRAYEALFSSRSQAMAERLGRGKPAHEDSLCLNCHVVTGHDLLHERKLLPKGFVTDGVGCESCHGPAEKWLTEHYKPSWKAMAAGQKQALGMKDTRPLVSRAKLCAECHVGAPPEKGGLGQDVYHDLYGAGHPPLGFEFGAYHATTLHHWSDAKDKDPRLGGVKDFETRAWLVGQVVSAQAALDLLAWRAAEEKRPWPEFAEMDCFACHHDLKGRSDRPKRDKPGSIPARSWHYAMLPRALEALGGPDAEVALRLDGLLKKLESNKDRSDVAKEARALSMRLDKVLTHGEEMPPLDLDKLYQTIRKSDVARVKDSWDNAAQVYLAFAALENTWNDLQVTATHGNLPSTLEEVRQGLRFPKGFLSPARFDGPAILRQMEKLR